MLRTLMIALSLFLLAKPSYADDKDRLLGTWKLLSAVHEDVATKERKQVCGERPRPALKFGYPVVTHAAGRPTRFAPCRFAPCRSAPGRYAPCRFALSRFALSRFALSRFALSRFALSRLALSRLALPRFAPCLSQPCQSTLDAGG